MRLRIQPRGLPNFSVVEIVKVLCQTVQWGIPNTEAHRDIIEHTSSACWKRWEMVNRSGANYTRTLQMNLESRLFSLHTLRLSCLHPFSLMKKRVELEKSGVTGYAAADEEASASAEEIFASSSDTTDLCDAGGAEQGSQPAKSVSYLKSPHSDLESLEAYRSAVKQALKLKALPEAVLKKVGVVDSVWFNFAFPGGTTFYENDNKEVAHHLDILCPPAGNPQLLHSVEDWSGVAKKVSFVQIIDCTTGRETPLTGPSLIHGIKESSSEVTDIDIPHAIAIAHAKLSLDGQKVAKIDFLHAPSSPFAKLYRSLQRVMKKSKVSKSKASNSGLPDIFFGVKGNQVPLAGLLEPEEISLLKITMPSGPNCVRDTPPDCQDWFVFSPEAKGTFGSVEPSIDETMPKEMFGYIDKRRIDLKIPNLWTYRVYTPDKNRQIDSTDLDEYCNCVFASLETKSGESLDVAAYEDSSGDLTVFFPSRRYVVEIHTKLSLKFLSTSRTREKAEIAETLRQLFVFLESQCPAGRSSGPWVKTRIEFRGSFVKYSLSVQQ